MIKAESLSSDTAARCLSLSGQLFGPCFNHGSPVHQSLDSVRVEDLHPLEPKSAGLSADGTCLQCWAGTWLMIATTRFAT